MTSPKEMRMMDPYFGSMSNRNRVHRWTRHRGEGTGIVTMGGGDSGGADDEESQRSPSPSPSTPPTGSGPGPYTLLPETPNQTGPSSDALKREQKFVDCLESPTVDTSGSPEDSKSLRGNAENTSTLFGLFSPPVLRNSIRLSGIQSKSMSLGLILSLERILYVWSVRHPASGYVQGINDLVMPFFKVFLTAYMNGEEADVGRLPAEALEAIEADSFWSLFKLLDGIQDNYIFAQPGIQRQVARMKELCERVDVID
ncbi:uncharacterized protein PGTG_00221 [Puccinia graminis f. sp. tritici CRL 75-36-700-3]|uniref:Rab-GAP TBC domain-containing protein n=1 Tax=Puccinia graminis f. sp. tritici (strain CRL 75-36-700-3 / race SCCL) TaxID=418459 RepID=E3JPS5_PUCGT|nr:uncharacterized protein PGTG_00221 [Puccinia graminis f. sp. tritici CRL 75-36-700-3]EFP74265.1 hypothetical protein PGTG_00221 [Puccinia graminis f. sp. tritici CRL 75-36-700-3]